MCVFPRVSRTSWCGTISWGGGHSRVSRAAPTNMKLRCRQRLRPCVLLSLLYPAWSFIKAQYRTSPLLRHPSTQFRVNKVQREGSHKEGTSEIRVGSDRFFNNLINAGRNNRENIGYARRMLLHPIMGPPGEIMTAQSLDDERWENRYKYK